MSDQPSAPAASTPAAPKRATTRRRASAGRRATKSTTRKKASATAATTAKRRGRPPGSRNKKTTAKRAPKAARTTRVAAANPADALSKRISDLVSENRTLKARVSELEAGLKKIEKAFGSEVSKVRRTVKRKTRSVAKKVTAAINAATP
jgi:hypothetical protein